MLLTIITLLSVFHVAQSSLEPLFDAVSQDNVKAIEQILTVDESIINVAGPGGQTPLMFAVLNGKLNSVKYLLSKGADASIGEKDGYTPMHGAGFQGRWKIAKELIRHGLDPRDKHIDGFEAIHRACWGSEQRHMETVKLFIKSGVPYNAKSDNGKTPLELAKPGTPVHKYLNTIHHETQTEL